jgi:signal transduction histidine kinase
MRIATKLTLILILAVAAVLAGFGYLRIRQERHHLTAQLQQEVMVLTKAIRLVVEHALRDRRPEDIRELLAEIVKDPNPVDRIRIFNNRLEETGVASTDAAAIAVVPQAELEKAVRGGTMTVRYLDAPPRPVVYAVLPLKNRQGAIVGGLEVVHVATRVERQMREAAKDLALRLSLLSLTIALAIWVTVRISIRRPIRALVRAALALGRGHLEQRTTLRRRDEIGQLASAFNRMAEDLQAAQERTQTEAQARLDLERRLQQEQKLATLGRLASEVAHEIGTPLNIVSGRTEAIRKGLPPDHPIVRHAATVLRQVERISAIIRQLFEYARPRRPAVRPVAVEPVLDRVVDLLEPLARRRQIRLTADPSNTTAPVLADPDQLQQVLLNLVTNALDATAPGGHIRLVVADEEQGSTPETSDARPRISRGQAAKPFVTLEVADTGCGIPQDRLEKIFEPFFSTKERRGGTGLGMPIVEDIVRSHRGAIEIESAAGRGTTVRLSWPAVDRHAPHPDDDGPRRSDNTMSPPEAEDATAGDGRIALGPEAKGGA